MDGDIDKGFKNPMAVLDHVLRLLAARRGSGGTTGELLVETFSKFPESDDSTSDFEAALWLINLVDSSIDSAVKAGKDEFHLKELRELAEQTRRLNLSSGRSAQFDYSQGLLREVELLAFDLPNQFPDTETIQSLHEHVDRLLEEASSALADSPDLLRQAVQLLDELRAVFSRSGRGSTKDLIDELDRIAGTITIQIISTPATEQKQIGFWKKLGGFALIASSVFTLAGQVSEGGRDIAGLLQPDGTVSAENYVLNATCEPSPKQLGPGETGASQD